MSFQTALCGAFPPCCNAQFSSGCNVFIADARKPDHVTQSEPKSTCTIIPQHIKAAPDSTATSVRAPPHTPPPPHAATAPRICCSLSLRTCTLMLLPLLNTLSSSSKYKTSNFPLPRIGRGMTKPKRCSAPLAMSARTSCGVVLPSPCTHHVFFCGGGCGEGGFGEGVTVVVRKSCCCLKQAGAAATRKHSSSSTTAQRLTRGV